MQTKAPELTIWNHRMLNFMKFCIDNGHADSQQDFLEGISFPFTNLRQVRSGLQSFRHEHFLAVCEKYKANMNWFYGLEKEMFRENKKTTPIEMLKAAVMAVENELSIAK